MTHSLSRLQTYYGHLEADELLRVMIKEEFKEKITLVSSFGAGSALLLSLVAEVDDSLPVMFLETGKHFPETLEYVDALTKHLGLKNVQLLKPDPALVNNIDKDGSLWSNQPNRCCWLRKVEPLQRALSDFKVSALITGRKRYQTVQRADMQTIELHDDGRFRINPLASWDKERVKAEFKKRGLPEHPLVEKGYLSIGCAPCTRIVKPGEDERSGRWAHTIGLPGGDQKSECGIHIAGKDVKVDQVPTTPDWSV